MSVMRFALVGGARTAKELWAYLPDNYAIIGGSRDDERGRPQYLICGFDYAGWTLDGYVIPRLSSGSIGAREIDPVEAVDFLRPV